MGKLPLANSLLDRDQVGNRQYERGYPLRVYYCEECGLIQLLDLVDKRKMFDEYGFLTATANTTVAHFDQYAEQLTKRLLLTDADLVVDIGSNDGTLLKAFKRRGSRVLGIEPARNVAMLAIRQGIPTMNEYFGPATVETIGQGRARLVTANNVVSHVPDLNEFLENVGKLLIPNGLFAFEVPWIVDVIRHNNFDIVYHEHLSYFGLKPLSDVLKRHGLELISFGHFPKIHGGTIRGLVGHRGTFEIDSHALERAYKTEEKCATFDALQQFADRAKKFRHRLFELLLSLKKHGKHISGYGAPAKATIVLNYCNIDNSILDFVSDNTPDKQGKFIPGVDIQIVTEEEFHKSRPDFALLLAWNYKDEILEKERDYLRSGGKFIVPFPEPELISWDVASSSPKTLQIPWVERGSGGNVFSIFHKLHSTSRSRESKYGGLRTCLPASAVGFGSRS